MGIFNRKQREFLTVENAVNVNEVDTNAVVRPFNFKFFGRGKKDFAAMFFYSILEKIFQGLENINWKTTEISFNAEDIVNFISRNSQLLVHHYFKNGFACIIVDKIGVRLPYQNELRFDVNRMVSNKNAVVVYSDPYIIERKTHYGIIAPMMEAINNNLNNNEFLTNNLGLYGILNGKGVPMSPAAKDELQKKLQKEYGFGEDKFNFILSNTELDYKAITIPVDQLKLNDNVDFEIKHVCRFFNINPDFIFGNSTFSNQAEAVRSFYQSAIIPLAEMLLKLARSTYIFTNETGKPSTIITYDLSNVPQYNTTLSSNCAEKGAYLEYLLKLRDAGVDITRELEELKQASKNMLSDI